MSIGILAAIAIPKFSSTRERAYFCAMKSDLKNQATQQEIHAALGTSEGCVVYYGTASTPSAPTTAANPGEVACTR